MKYVLNALSLNMFSQFPLTFSVKEVTIQEASAAAVGVPSGVGHADTAAVFSEVLGLSVPMNRVSGSLSSGDEVLVGQYSGPRLVEGATTLPEGASIKWLVVSVA